jgi:sugar phosphate isomerase/epimerase
MKLAEFGMDTVSLAGPLEAQLAAIRGAGFSQVTLHAGDLVGHPGGLQAAVAAVRGSGLRVDGFRVLRDYEGLTGHLHTYKVDIAKSMLEMCAELDCKLLLVSSSTSANSSADDRVLARDLAKLAMLALPLGIRVAYKALAWGHAVKDYVRAWEVVTLADVPNLGLGIDSFQLFASQSSIEDLDLVDPWKIFLVQLSDFMWHGGTGTATAAARGQAFHVFPGEGVQGEALAALVRRLDELGYRGDYSFNVDNDDYRQLPLPTVAERARRSASWLAEDVLRRSTPLPNRVGLRKR